MNLNDFAEGVAEAVEAREDLDGYAEEGGFEGYEANQQSGEPYEDLDWDYEQYARKPAVRPKPTGRRAPTRASSQSSAAMPKKTKGWLIIGGIVAVGMALGAVGLYVYAKIRSRKQR